MVISYQLSTHSMYRLILVRCILWIFVMWCICFILDGNVARILYTVKSKQFNVLFSS